MHPPPFRLTQRLSEWPDCRLELNCSAAPVLPVRLLAQDRGDQTFAAIVTRLRCSKCGRPPGRSICAQDTANTIMAHLPTGRSSWCQPGRTNRDIDRWAQHNRWPPPRGERLVRVFARHFRVAQGRTGAGLPPGLTRCLTHLRSRFSAVELGCLVTGGNHRQY